jgi:hypothetical protein
MNIPDFTLVVLMSAQYLEPIAFRVFTFIGLEVYASDTFRHLRGLVADNR